MPASAQSASRLHCAAESGINRIVAMRAPPGPVILPGSTGRREALPPTQISPGKRITPRCRRYGERHMGLAAESTSTFTGLAG